MYDLKPSVLPVASATQVSVAEPAMYDLKLWFLTFEFNRLESGLFENFRK